MPSLAELLDTSAQWGRGVQNKISDLVSLEAWAQALRNPPRVLSQYQQMQPGQQQETIDQGIDAAMNFGPAVLGSLRQVGSKIYNDATGHFVEYVKTPKISGYRIGEKGTFEGKSDPSFDQYLGNWLKPEYQTEQEAWAAIPQILKQEQKTTALKKYSNIPNHWSGVDKTIAKTLVDEFGPESINFISSARSSSKYINTPYGKIRISDHTLPGQYEDAALDLNRSMNKKDLLEQIKKFSNPE